MILILLHAIQIELSRSKRGKLKSLALKNDVICEDVLRDIYDLEIKIQEINGQRICVYFDDEYIEEDEIKTLAM